MLALSELIGQTRRIADSCERAEARAQGDSRDDANVAAMRANDEYEASRRLLASAGVAVTEVRVPPVPAASSPAVRKHKGRRS